jgi:hypothetical protein
MHNLKKVKVANSFRVNQFAFSSPSSQTATRIGEPDLFVFQPGNSTQIHLWIGMGLLCNVSAQTSNKGFYEINIGT